MTYYFDMDGVIANFHKDFDPKKRFQQALNREWIANLEPFMNNVNLLKNLLLNNRVYILTRAANEAAKEGKKDWLRKYIPELNLEKYFLCITDNTKKVDLMREEGILIDDDIKQTRPWKKAGHKAITLIEKGENINLENAEG